MGWRDTYRAASFRAAVFYVETADSSHGRRQAVHEHAQRDIPYTEDLGRKGREFSIVGYLVGADYHLQRDELIKACEQAGPGQLVHPYRGEMTVACRGLTVSESSAEGGFCKVAMTFLESGEASFPSAKVDTINVLSSKGNSVTEVAKQGFIKDFTTTGFPAHVAEAAKQQLKELGEFMASPGFDLAGELQAASDFYYQASGLASEAGGLIQTPAAMLSRVVGLVTGVRSAFGANAFSMLTSLFDRSSGSYTGSLTTPSRKQQAANYTALNTVVRQTAIAEAAKAAVVTQVATSTPAGVQQVSTEPTKYDSFQAAVQTRDAIVDRLDTESEATVSDDAYVVLTDLRTAVVQAVPSPDQNLAQLVEYTPRQTLPSLVLAHQLYGDASRADEIAARNSLRHPGFVVGGKQLEVLADG